MAWQLIFANPSLTTLAFGHIMSNICSVQDNCVTKVQFYNNKGVVTTILYDLVSLTPLLTDCLNDLLIYRPTKSKAWQGRKPLVRLAGPFSI